MASPAPNPKLIACLQEGAEPLSCPRLIVAVDLLPNLSDVLHQTFEEKVRLTGADLAGSTYHHVL